VRAPRRATRARARRRAVLTLAPRNRLSRRAKARKGLEERGWRGAFLGGNYAAGVALGRCVEGAYESAAEVAAWLAAAPAPTGRR
jgi:hypothetical protein